MRLRFLAAFMPGLGLPVSVDAKGVPLWEFGMGVAGLSVPYYRGSDQGKSYFIPLPYLIYRGERFKVDDAGMRGNIFRSNRMKLDISLAAGVPVPKDTNGIRAGMPSLAPTIELGPSLELRLWDDESTHHSFWLRFPLRAALSVGRSGMEHQGWAFAPYMEYVFTDGVQSNPWRASASLGPLYADKNYHAYFYDVPSAYATNARPEYHAGAGYSGSRITVALRKRFGDVWAGVFARYDVLSGAVFENSPLVSSKGYHAVGFGVVWIFAKSSRMVDKDSRILEAEYGRE